jgi:hypothetical protein
VPCERASVWHGPRLHDVQVFMRARKYPDLGWQAYVASAQMEWQHDRKDQIPRNILELGLKAFLGVPEYVEHYVAFLLGEAGPLCLLRLVCLLLLLLCLLLPLCLLLRLCMSCAHPCCPLERGGAAVSGPLLRLRFPYFLAAGCAAALPAARCWEPGGSSSLLPFPARQPRQGEWVGLREKFKEELPEQSSQEEEQDDNDCLKCAAASQCSVALLASSCLTLPPRLTCPTQGLVTLATPGRFLSAR